MGRPTTLDDGWWLAILWVADDDGVVSFRDVAPAAGPPPEPPLARLGPALSGALSGFILEDGGRLVDPAGAGGPARRPASAMAVAGGGPGRLPLGADAGRGDDVRMSSPTRSWPPSGGRSRASPGPDAAARASSADALRRGRPLGGARVRLRAT